MTNFTQGKWKVGSNSFSSNVFTDEKLIATLVSEPSENSNEREANARLIAHAPEMYRMLQHVIPELGFHTGNREKVKALLAHIDGKDDNHD